MFLIRRHFSSRLKIQRHFFLLKWNSSGRKDESSRRLCPHSVYNAGGAFCIQLTEKSSLRASSLLTLRRVRQSRAQVQDCFRKDQRHTGHVRTEDTGEDRSEVTLRRPRSTHDRTGILYLPNGDLSRYNLRKFTHRGNTEVLAVVAPRFSRPLSRTRCHPSAKNPGGKHAVKTLR